MVAGDEQALAAHLGRQHRGLATGRGADVQHPIARPGLGRVRDELRRFFLHDELVAPLDAEAAQGAGRQPHGAVNVRSRCGLDARRPQVFEQHRPGAAIGGTNSELRRLVVELAPSLGRLEAISGEPPVGEPFRMRQRDGQVLQAPRRGRQARPAAVAA